jgi:carbamoyl-phosphate synthase large subunit
LQRGVPYYTTMPGARAAGMAIEAMLKKGLTIRSLQEYHHIEGVQAKGSKR